MPKLKDKLKESKLQYEDLSENIIAPEQQSIVASNDKSELNVVYDQGMYMLDDGSSPLYVATKAKFKKAHKEYREHLKKVFSQPTTLNIRKLGDHLGGQYNGYNKITINEDVFLATGETIRKKLENEDIIDCSKMSEDEIAQKNMAYQTIYLTSVISHEKKHRNNDKMGCNERNIAPEFEGKLNMMDEVSANLTQAAVALNYYRTTGRTEGFDFLYCCGNEAIDNIKKYVTDPQNKDKLTSEETKKFITEQVRDGWLSKNNNYQEYAQLLSEKILQDFAKYEQSGNEADLQYAKYMCGKDDVDKDKDIALEFFEQYKKLHQESNPLLAKEHLKESIKDYLLKEYSFDHYHEQARTHISSHIMFSATTWIDDYSSQKEYETRVNRMFGDIPGMGDVSGYINPNFELNAELKSLKSKTPEMKAFLENAANGADNPIDAEENIIASLEPIKIVTEKANADGTVTPEEQQEIDAVTRETINRINSLRGSNKPNETAQSTETTQPTQTNTLPPFLASKGQNTL